MEMEVDEVSNIGNGSSNHNSLFVCCITKKSGLKKTKIPITGLGQLTLEDLRLAVLQELNSWEWADDNNDKPQNFDILHQSRTLLTDEDVKKIGPLSVITVVKKDKDSVNVSNEENHKSAKFIAEYAASRHIHDNLRSCSLALRTAFLNPKFVTMVENLGDSDMLENIFAIVPELKSDPVAIGIIQDPSLIFHLSDPDSLKKLANVKPWVIEAFNFISASIHQEKGNNQPQGIPSHLFNASLFDGEDEAMDDDDDEAGGPSPRGSGSRITREQVAAALSALGGGSSAGPALSGSNAFGGLFSSPSAGPQQPAGVSRSNPGPGSTAGGTNIQNLMNTLTGAGGGLPGQPLNSDMVARAVTEALRRLTPEQRADQLNAIRNFATQLQQGSSSAPSAPTPSTQQPVPVPAQPPQPAPQDTSSSLRQQYQSQLQQMRDLGITDERLSILALRVSEGDLNTAVELIFSGWQGEGSDPID